jgi:thioredoxin-like negative regulator of GroEL
MSKYFVFVKINGDEQPSVKQAFGVSAYPTIKFLKKDGTTVVHEVVGYEPLNEFLADMQKAMQLGGIGQ